jgi:deoxyribonuclease V
VAGIDVAASRRTGLLWAGVVVLTYPDLLPVEAQWIRAGSHFPYIPGLLSFREIPPLLRAMGKLKTAPDLFLCDGQGIAHPRGLGIASHLGVLTQTPSIGCAKSRLVGAFEPVKPERGSRVALIYKGRRVGAVVRTRTGVKPLFVSPGHAVTVDQAAQMVLRCGGRFRIPEPIRQAHLMVNRIRRQQESSPP